jgi:hypothetical protein
MKQYHTNDDDFEIINGKKYLRDGHRYRAGPITMMDSLPRDGHGPVCITDGSGASLPRVHDGTGDSGLAMHRPGFRVTDAPLSDELQRAHDAYEHDLTTAWRRGTGKNVVPDAPKAIGNDAIPVHDIETAYRLYCEEISQAWKTPR